MPKPLVGSGTLRELSDRTEKGSNKRRTRTNIAREDQGDKDSDATQMPKHS